MRDVDKSYGARAADGGCSILYTYMTAEICNLIRCRVGFLYRLLRRVVVVGIVILYNIILFVWLFFFPIYLYIYTSAHVKRTWLGVRSNGNLPNGFRGKIIQHHTRHESVCGKPRAFIPTQ